MTATGEYTKTCKACNAVRPLSDFTSSKLEKADECRYCKARYDLGYRAGKRAGIDNLNKILTLQAYRQRTSFGINFETMTTEERIEFIRWNVLALQAELIEALDEVGWKPWASSRHINREAFLGELVDAQHFLNNLYLVIGAEAEEIAFRYVDKSSTNAKRQEENYDGVSTKCPVCSRALDDKFVLCGPKIGCTKDIEALGDAVPWPVRSVS